MDEILREVNLFFYSILFLSIPFLFFHHHLFPFQTNAETGRNWTGKQVIDTIKSLSRGFQEKLKLKKGDVVCFLIPNSDIQIMTMFAVIAAGGVFAGTGHDFPARELLYTVSTSNARIIIGTKENLDSVLEIKQKSNHVEQIVTLEKVDNSSTGFIELSPESSSRICIDDLITIGRESSLDPVVAVNDKVDFCTIHFSSGTTGPPKPGIRTHFSLNSIIRIISHPGKFVFDPSITDSFYLQNLVIHGGGTSYLILCLLSGVRVVTTHGFGSPEKFISNMNKYKCTTCMIVPSMLISLANYRNEKSANSDHNESSRTESEVSKLVPTMNDVAVTGAVCDPASARRFVQKYEPKILKILFGMTEIGYTTMSSNESVRVNGIDYESNGTPLPGVSIKVVDHESGKKLPLGERGEILVKSSYMMHSYLNLPEATKDSFDSSGFFKSGDCGYIDSHGKLFIVDRYKEIIKCRGLAIAPSELEQLLLQLDCVHEAVVVGIKDDFYHEIPRAFIVLKSGLEESEKVKNHILNFINSNIDPGKQLLGGIHFLSTLPRTTLEKVQRSILRNMKI